MQFPYTEALLKEALRYWPPATGAARQAAEDYELPYSSKRPGYQGFGLVTTLVTT